MKDDLVMAILNFEFWIMNYERKPDSGKSYAFALEIIDLYRKLGKANEYVLSKQLLRSGTSIGAIVEEA